MSANFNFDVISAVEKTADGNYIQTQLKPVFFNAGGIRISDPVSTIFSAATDLTGNIINAVSRKKERKLTQEMEQKKIAQQNTLALMKMIEEEDNRQLKKQNQENTIIIVSAASMLLFTIFLIMIKRRAK